MQSVAENANLDVKNGALGAELTRDIVNAYLSRDHLDNIDVICPLIALPSDVARGGHAVKAAYRQVLGAMIEMFSNGMSGNAKTVRERALALCFVSVEWCWRAVLMMRGLAMRCAKQRANSRWSSAS